MDLHDCCEEYAEGCVSCNLHEDIRRDERYVISTLLDKMIDWKNQELRSRVLNLVSKGSSINQKTFIENPEVDVQDGSAYIWIKKDKIKPPLTTLSDVECNIDIDADSEVIGVEIINWPEEKEDE